MAGVVIFDQAAFLLRYPQFSAYATANPGALQIRFDEVTALYINNTGTAYVGDVVTRSMLINFAIAHVLILDGVLSSGGEGSTSTQVGRVGSASEGSVSASLDMGAQPNTAAWWNQTQPGASYWNATARFRTFRYARRPCYGR